MSNLIIAEHDGSEIKAATLHTVTAAQAAGGDITVAVIGSGCGAAAEAAAKIAGVAKVLVADSAEYEKQLAENVAPAIVKMAEGYSHVWAPATTNGKNVMPRVAALLDVQQLSDITAVQSATVFERPIYAGNAIATVESAESTNIITVRTTAFEAAAAEGGSASV